MPILLLQEGCFSRESESRILPHKELACGGAHLHGRLVAERSSGQNLGGRWVPSAEQPGAGLVVERELARAVAGHPDAHDPQEHGQPRREGALPAVEHCLCGLRLEHRGERKDLSSTESKDYCTLFSSIQFTARSF